MVEQRRDAHQFVEHRVQVASTRRSAGFCLRLVEVGRRWDRVDQQDSIVGKQPVELSAHRSERTGLYLDKQIAAANVDDKTVELDLHLVTAFDEKVL